MLVMWTKGSEAASRPGLYLFTMAADDILTTPAVRAPAFPTNVDWINTGGRALTLDELLGKVVLLDFWTYG